MTIEDAKKILSGDVATISPEILQEAVKIILSELNKADKKISVLEKNLKSIENLPGEVWKDVEGYEGLYKISNKGRVKSLRWNGERILKATKNNYMCLTLTIDGKQKHHNVHVLVERAFIPNPENKSCVNHIDGNKQNNCVENLEWATYSENILHAYRTGLKDPMQNSKKGEKNGAAKFTDEQARFIREIYIHRDRNFGSTALAKKFGVSRNTIEKIVNGVTYTEA